MPPEKTFETNTDEKGPLECQPPQFSFPFLSSQAADNPTAPSMEAPLPAKMHDNCLSKTLAPGNFLVLLLLLNPHPSIISCSKKFFQDEPFPTETINTRFEKCVFNPNVCWQQIWGVRDITTCDPILSVSHRVCLWGIQQINCLAFLYLLPLSFTYMNEYTSMCMSSICQQWQFQSTISSVQLLSRVRLFVTPWTAARQASQSITILKFYRSNA